MSLPKAITKKEFARLIGRDIRSVTNYLADGLPVDRTGKTPRIPLDRGITWYVDHERELARAGKGLNELDQMRARKTLAEAQKSEIELAQLEGRVILSEAAEAVNGEMCDRLSAVLVNIPANYSLHLERLGVPADKAEVVLEEIQVELTNALRAVADDLEAAQEDEDGDGSHAGDSAA